MIWNLLNYCDYFPVKLTSLYFEQGAKWGWYWKNVSGLFKQVWINDLDFKCIFKMWYCKIYCSWCSEVSVFIFHVPLSIPRDLSPSSAGKRQVSIFQQELTVTQKHIQCNISLWSCPVDDIQIFCWHVACLYIMIDLKHSKFSLHVIKSPSLLWFFQAVSSISTAQEEEEKRDGWGHTREQSAQTK